MIPAILFLGYCFGRFTAGDALDCFLKNDPDCSEIMSKQIYNSGYYDILKPVNFVCGRYNAMDSEVVYQLQDHPWIEMVEDNSVDEEIRYSLDEIRVS